jgi:8-oxo-dGTP diphosphatase
MDTKVGIGVAILKTDKYSTQVLLGNRKGSHGEGEWAFPGGKMEHLESFNETALREIAEEVGTNLKVKDLQVCSIVNLTEYAPKHYLDIGMFAEWAEGDPEVMEPDKCTEWKWFDIDDLPSPLFVTVERVLDAAVSPYLHRYDTAVVYDKGQF